jgi:hypothetical protein
VASALIRCVLVALALVAGAWLVVGVRALDLESEAGVSQSGSRTMPLAPEDVEPALRALRRSRLLSVDKESLLNEGLVLFGSGRRREGIRVVRRAAAGEPENLDAWLSLHYLYTTADDRRRAAWAARRVRALNPLAADQLER